MVFVTTLMVVMMKMEEALDVGFRGFWDFAGGEHSTGNRNACNTFGILSQNLDAQQNSVQSAADVNYNAFKEYKTCLACE
ncbi:hypothetical protein AK812_SmicGene1131 [Symbiodinium microadriaticum]|uniref:Uncharacterized protein n=1 Tax=Symbiodinium microadriaticum TaxID=2951 RepID=A0A1Q9F4R3_SYMMI|nr:hypothetical protein AK812_SmicGene1131 [Symbiodinium microadriaticum]